MLTVTLVDSAAILVTVTIKLKCVIKQQVVASQDVQQDGRLLIVKQVGRPTPWSLFCHDFLNIYFCEYVYSVAHVLHICPVTCESLSFN